MKQNLNSKIRIYRKQKIDCNFPLESKLVQCSVHKMQFNLYQIEMIFQSIRLQKPGLLTSLIVHIKSIRFLDIDSINTHPLIFFIMKIKLLSSLWPMGTNLHKLALCQKLEIEPLSFLRSSYSIWQESTSMSLQRNIWKVVKGEKCF